MHMHYVLFVYVLVHAYVRTYVHTGALRVRPQQDLILQAEGGIPPDKGESPNLSTRLLFIAWTLAHCVNRVNAFARKTGEDGKLFDLFVTERALKFTDHGERWKG